MLRFKISRRPALVLVAALPFGLASLAALAVNPDTTTLPNGAALSVQIDNPLQDEEFKVPAAAGPGGTIDVPVDGEASVGQGVPNITLVYVLDVSGSTIINSCLGGTILDCEVQAILNVQADPNISSVKEAGVAIFADGGNTADMPGLLTNQTAHPGNVATVVNSAFSSTSGGAAGVTQFSLRQVAAGQTDFSQGLQAAITILGASTSATDRVIYLSDGGSTQQNAPGGFAGQLAAMVGTGAVVDAFAVGPASNCSLGSAGTLQQIANATGGTCTNVPNPGTLPSLLPNLLFTSLDSVQVAVNGGNVATNTLPGLPAVGPVTADYDALPNLGVGDYNVTAMAEGHDNAGMDTVVADVDIHLLQLTAGPPSEVNELSLDNAHGVTAAILGGTGPVRNIDFLVGGQNAATAMPGAAAIPATPGGAAVGFNYTVPIACPSLGQDTITVSTMIAGMDDSILVTKDWVDTIAPEATCTPTVNPHGKNEPNAPGNGGQGQNQDGFYLLEASDNLVDGCAPLVINAMDADGFVFGPFGVGDIIKYTQDDDAVQEEKKMGSTGGGNNGKSDAVTAHLKGHGDLIISATDGAGNTGPEVTCLVPKPPK